LALEKRIVEAIGDRITADSTATSGSRFTIDLPLRDLPVETSGLEPPTPCLQRIRG
jgi:signal transduction histidine kinase